MAFPIIPIKRSGAAGNPSSLNLGELAVNTLTGELFLGADAGVTLLNGPVSAGTTVTEATGDGTSVAFTFSGYNGTADGGYIVSVGGIDQPPSTYSISATAGGTITFVEAPTDGELISIRAIVAGGGGGGGTDIGGRAWSATETYTEGDLVATAQRETWICIQSANIDHDPTTSPLWWQPMPADAVSLQLVPVATTTPTTGQGLVYNGTAWAPATPQSNATQIQGRNVASTAPTAGQVLAWDAATSTWKPASLNGSITFSGPGSYTWMVPAWVRWVQLDVVAGSGSSANVTDGADGSSGVDGNIDADGNVTLPTTGANGADGTSEPGVEGNSIQLASDYITPVIFTGGAAGTAGTAGLGGGGGGGGGFFDGGSTIYSGAPGGRGNGYYGGYGGAEATVAGHGAGGAAGGGGATAGSDGNLVGGGAGGIGANNGGDGGSGGGVYGGSFNGGGGGGGDYNAGGGGGGGGFNSTVNSPYGGAPGKGGKAVPGEPGQAGETFSGGFDLSANAGKLLSISIYNSDITTSNTGTITITW